ncbi:hypothetical protein RJ639_018404 [Escallonia herrerae]|uniref:ER lumen protein-retaining receptor n=1 Tax=Escallonia herrerae TaxID=1293975 RepID=A0AA88VAB9_9ASTE|nr:hypothetical protein RJ639_018404 [Escallonia herrerae]
MNVFRLAGDMTHLLSIVVLLLKIRTTKSCAAISVFVIFDYLSLVPGISLKTQELYVIVFLTRYLDLFTKYYSFYNTLMKLVFLGTSIAIVWYMRYHKPVKLTYNKDQDTFRHYFLILSCLALALLVHRAFFVIEVLWTFSVYLEAVAILPQLVLVQRFRNIDNLTGNYVFLLGTYRALYIINWVYRFFMENHQVRWIPWVSGVVQTALYADFFYYYIKRYFSLSLLPSVFVL